jgi:tRNA (guanine37-N1)-methyltransferase
VVKKKGPHLGKYRIQKYELIAGEPKYEVIHKENQLNLKLNINETYYSPRSANERMRIARLVKPNESVLVMFSGIGPYALVLSKFSRAKKIIGVEINEKAHEYALENAKLNKSNNIEFYKGDVNKIVPKLNEKFDRIIMPLPKTSVTYLPLALKYIKHSGIIHFYDFSEESKIPSSTINKIQAACEKSKRKFKILKITKCGQQSPRVYRVCADFQVT